METRAELLLYLAPGKLSGWVKIERIKDGMPNKLTGEKARLDILNIVDEQVFFLRTE